jgi:SnoaL-like domain
MDLHNLQEIEQIKHLKARYFRFLDAKQWTDWRTCFTDDLHFFAGQDAQPLAPSADEFVAYVSKLLAGTVTVHHGHMPEIELTSATTATGIWAMFDWVDWSQTATPERTFQGYGHYVEEYEKGVDGQWRIKRVRLTRLRVDYLNAKKEGS